MSGPVLVIELLEGGIRGVVFTGPTSTAPLNSAYVRVQPDKSALGQAAEKAFTDALAGLLASLGAGSGEAAAGAEGGWADYSGVFGEVYLCLPPGAPSLRVLKLPFTDRARIREVLGYELAGLLPYEASEAVTDGIPIEGGRVLAVAVEKRVLAGYLGALKSFGLDPVWAGLTGLLMPGYIDSLTKPEGAAAFVSTSFISVGRHGKPVFFNTFPDAEGLRLSLEYLAAEGVGVDKFYCVQETEAAVKKLTGGRCAVERIELPEKTPARLAPSLALMDALKQGRLAETVDLRTGEFEYTEIKARAGRRLKVTVALVCAIAVLLMGDLYMGYARHTGVKKAYDAALTAEYLKLFPGERASSAGADPVYLLNAKIKALDKEARVAGGGVEALGLLNALTKAAGVAPEMKIRLFDVTAADGRLAARGEGASFEAANRLKELLEAEPAFHDVQLSEVKAGPTGTVSFGLSAGI